MAEKKWMRVSDPISPLDGCDVLVTDEQVGEHPWRMVYGLRRIDVFVGNRPFQLIAEDKGNIGVMVNPLTLTDSPLGDDVVEMSTTTPHGKFVSEDLYRGPEDGPSMMVVRFSRAYQVALLDVESRLMATNTWYSDVDEELMEIEMDLVGLFRANIPQLVEKIKRGE